MVAMLCASFTMAVEVLAPGPCIQIENHKAFFLLSVSLSLNRYHVWVSLSVPAQGICHVFGRIKRIILMTPCQTY
jgi:hypothetical protein